MHDPVSRVEHNDKKRCEGRRRNFRNVSYAENQKEQGKEAVAGVDLKKSMRNSQLL